MSVLAIVIGWCVVHCFATALVALLCWFLYKGTTDDTQEPNPIDEMGLACIVAGYFIAGSIAIFTCEFREPNVIYMGSAGITPLDPLEAIPIVFGLSLLGLFGGILGNVLFRVVRWSRPPEEPR